MANLIAVTPRSLSLDGHHALGALVELGYEVVFPAPGRQPTETELLKWMPDCVGYLAGVEPVTRVVLQAAPRLRVISRNGIGCDNIDVEACKSLGIAVERAVGANSRAVAELAITLVLAALRHVPWSDRGLREGVWRRRLGHEALGKTVGLVGCGAVGRQVSEMALAMGMTVLAHDPLADPSYDPGASFSRVSLPSLLSHADVITLHCPPTAVPLIDEQALALMKFGTILVNTARADLVDEHAILRALTAGTLSVFATDVYRTEPPERSPLLDHDNVILMPHAGAYTHESVDRATILAVKNLVKVLSS